MNEDHAGDNPLAVTVGKGLANKLGNAQKSKHLGLRDSTDFLENVSKLYFANHITKLFTDYFFVMMCNFQRKYGQRK